MTTASIAVEGESDVAAVEKILACRAVKLDPRRVFVKRGKGNLDAKLSGFNSAATRSPWFVLRDADQDADDCAATLRELLLPAAEKSAGMCFRLAVRELEAWLLADREAFATTFAVSIASVPADVEGLIHPKTALVDLCRRSRKSAVKKGMVPPPGSVGRVGPEYVTLISSYAEDAWRPDVAAANSPSLARALLEIDRLLAEGTWR